MAEKIIQRIDGILKTIQRVQNEIDRFHLVIAALKEIPKYKNNSKVLIDWCQEMLKQHSDYISQNGDDMPYIKNWKWDNNLIKKL